MLVQYGEVLASSSSATIRSGPVGDRETGRPWWRFTFDLHSFKWWMASSALPAGGGDVLSFPLLPLVHSGFGDGPDAAAALG